MLSARLIRLIESHYQQIVDRTLREISRQSDLAHLHRLPEAELRERTQVILEHLGDWLAGNAEELGKKQEEIGRRRFEQTVPLHEAVRALCTVKNSVIDFIEEQGIPRDSLGLYAEQELEHRLGQFFDTMIIHLVRGYEVAWHRAMRSAA
jgi:hypothetical protein